MTITTKYDKGQTVYLVNQFEIVSAEIVEISYTNGRIMYALSISNVDKNFYHSEDSVFPSLDDLFDFYRKKLS